MIAVGDVLPDFELKNQNGETVKLSDFKGKKVLLSFHPLAFTPVCADQMKELDSRMDDFEKLSTVPLGFSVDQSFSKNAWAKFLDLKKLQLLADFWPQGGYAQKLELFREKDGFSERANIIADENKKVIFVKIYPIHDLPDFQEILDFLRKK